ncbi:MAG: hypothetical protein JJD92_00400 [Frankiaceae bacterium]|nr:hypothetical protein [Frankiaceae bacterium]
MSVHRLAHGQPWPEADRLFRRIPGWHGADAAYSVPLSGERTLWLFGDTFVGPSRRESRMVHNSIGVQQGDDPSSAPLVPHFGGAPDDPRPFFGSEPGTWLWPMAGARTPVGVVVFFMRVRSARPDLPTVIDAWRAEGSLNFFDVFDWTAALIENPDEPVEQWVVRMLDTPPVVDRVMPGAGVVADGGHLYAYGWRDGHALRPGRIRRRPRYRGFRHPRLAYLLRWPVEQIPTGLRDPQWWCGNGWSVDAARAAPVIDSPATEFTVHRDGDRFVLTEAAAWLRGVDGVPALRFLRVLKRLPKSARLLTVLGLLTVSVSVREASALEGPWSDPVRVHTPKVARDVHVYAGKGHPQLGGDELVCTYAQIALKCDRTLDDEGLYYPRFVRVPSA